MNFRDTGAVGTMVVTTLCVCPRDPRSPARTSPTCAADGEMSSGVPKTGLQFVEEVQHVLICAIEWRVFHVNLDVSGAWSSSCRRAGATACIY